MEHDLFPVQRTVVDSGILDLGFSAVLSLQTGSGKTRLGELAIDRALQRGERAAYLTPLRALAEEKISTWSGRWPGARVGIFTGDYDSASAPLAYRDSDVAICTFERLDGVLRNWQQHLGWLSTLGVVVVDELHLLMDPERGPRLEGTLSRLRRVNPFCRVIGLSATVSNHAELAEWLGGVSHHSAWRPVPLHHQVRFFKRLSDKAGLVLDIVRETASEGSCVLVFSSSRRRSEGLAAMLRENGVTAGHHHAGLSVDERTQVEADFREGKLLALIATPTLEMGLNLPCSTVVIADDARWNGERFEPLPVWNYLQRAGRAGRPEQGKPGLAILLRPTWARNAKDYAHAVPEPVRSHLTSEAKLAEQVMVEIACRACRTRQQLAGNFLPSTLGYRQAPAIQERLGACIEDLIDAGAVTENEGGILQATKLGWASVRHHLTPASARYLVGLTQLSLEGPLSDFDLFLYHCWDPGLSPKLPLAVEVVELLEERICSVPSRLLDQGPPSRIEPRLAASGVLMAALCWCFVEAPREFPGLIEGLDVYLSDAGLLRDALVRLLRASADLQSAAAPGRDVSDLAHLEILAGPSLPCRLRRLATRLEFGLSSEAADFTRLKGCGGLLALRLFEHGVEGLEELCQTEPADLCSIPGVGPKRAMRWIDEAGQLVQRLEPEAPHQPTVSCRSIPLPNGWPKAIEPGRLLRALELRVEGKLPRFLVGGGAEEHQVTRDACDCADYTAHGTGWWCKHRLAVRLLGEDRELSDLVDRLRWIAPPTSLAGHLMELVLGRRCSDA